MYKRQQVYRISFNEITKNAVKASFKSPRDIDMHLVLSLIHISTGRWRFTPTQGKTGTGTRATAIWDLTISWISRILRAAGS